MLPGHKGLVSRDHSVTTAAPQWIASRILTHSK